jgi:hypothetical protein
MDRRTFLRAATAVVVAPQLSNFKQALAQGNASLSIGSLLPINAIPHDFAGLSYESAQLANPNFFSPQNKELVGLFRELAPRGNLRIGGGSSEYTTYSDDAPGGAPPFEVFGPDTSKTVKHGTVTSALALRNLRGFLDATNWSCIYGVNLGQGSADNAAREAAAAYSSLRPRLIALQIGNESDSFRKRYRPETYTPADFLTEWTRFHEAIVKTTPQARFAGPDISNKLEYLTAFAAEAPRHSDVVLLTSHYYAMGPAGNPAATLDNLLDPDPKLTTLKKRDLHVIQEACEKARLPYRMSEGNSCWDGGKPGVSDTYAAALWCADYMLQGAQRGWAGINLHGGGNGSYTAIAGAPSTGFTRRPEYFGMSFAQHFTGTRFVEATLKGTSPRVNAFVFDRNGKHELTLINKTPEAVICDLPTGVTAAPFLSLSGPAIDAKDDIKVIRVSGSHRRTAIAAPYSATAYHLK